MTPKFSNMLGTKTFGTYRWPVLGNGGENEFTVGRGSRPWTDSWLGLGTHEDLLPSTPRRKLLLSTATLTDFVLHTHTCLGCPGCSLDAASQASQLWHPRKRSAFHPPSVQFQQKSLSTITLLFLHAPNWSTYTQPKQAAPEPCWLSQASHCPPGASLLVT